MRQKHPSYHYLTTTSCMIQATLPLAMVQHANEMLLTLLLARASVAASSHACGPCNAGLAGVDWCTQQKTQGSTGMPAPWLRVLLVQQPHNSSRSCSRHSCTHAQLGLLMQPRTQCLPATVPALRAPACLMPSCMHACMQAKPSAPPCRRQKTQTEGPLQPQNTSSMAFHPIVPQQALRGPLHWMPTPA